MVQPSPAALFLIALIMVWIGWFVLIMVPSFVAVNHPPEPVIMYVLCAYIALMLKPKKASKIKKFLVFFMNIKFKV
jgi:hypothetical protein